MTNTTELNGKHDAASTRIAELEAENARLRDEMTELRRVQQLDRECWIAHLMDDFPKSEAEFLRVMREGPTLKEVLNKLDLEESEEAAA